MSSLEAGAWIWRPPSPYEYVLVKEVLAMSLKRMRPDEYRLVKMLLEEYDGTPSDNDISFDNMSRESVQELLTRVRFTIREWLDGETKAHWTDWNKHKGKPARG